MKRFVLTKPAERDVEQIKSYLACKAGPTITRRVMTDIRSALSVLGAGHTRQDLTSRSVKFWPVYSYLIVYDTETQPVRIIRVLHVMRDVGDTLN